MLRTAFLTASLAGIGTTGFAQDAATSPDAAVSAAENQLGVLQYCVNKGYIDHEAVDTQKKMMAILPKPQNEQVVKAAYDKGLAGTVSAMGVEQTLADAANAQNSDEATLCGQLAQMVEQAGAQMQQ